MPYPTHRWRQFSILVIDVCLFLSRAPVSAEDTISALITILFPQKRRLLSFRRKLDRNSVKPVSKREFERKKTTSADNFFLMLTKKKERQRTTKKKEKQRDPLWAQITGSLCLLWYPLPIQSSVLPNLDINAWTVSRTARLSCPPSSLHPSPFLSHTLITHQAQTPFSFIPDTPVFFSLLPPLLALWEVERDLWRLKWYHC